MTCKSLRQCQCNAMHKPRFITDIVSSQLSRLVSKYTARIQLCYGTSECQSVPSTSRSYLLSDLLESLMINLHSCLMSRNVTRLTAPVPFNVNQKPKNRGSMGEQGSKLTQSNWWVELCIPKQWYIIHAAQHCDAGCWVPIPRMSRNASNIKIRFVSSCDPTTISWMFPSLLWAIQGCICGQLFML